jgi:hypothetical protein
MSPKKRGNTFMVKLIVLFAALSEFMSAQSPSVQLSGIKRICVEKFSGDEIQAAQARDLAITSLFDLNRFTISEKCDKADAILRGTVAEDKSQQSRSESEGTAIRKGSAAVSGAGGSFAGAAATLGAAGSESLSSSETKWQATVALRLATPDGDVIWAGSQDSSGGKVKSAMSDAVDRAIKQLGRAAEKASSAK